MNKPKMITIYPGTVTEALAWAKQHGVDRRLVLSARQVTAGALRGRVLRAEFATDGWDGNMSRALFDDLLEAVSDHNRIAAATSRAAGL